MDKKTIEEVAFEFIKSVEKTNQRMFYVILSLILLMLVVAYTYFTTDYPYPQITQSQSITKGDD